MVYHNITTMKKIILIIIALSLLGCGTTKKVVETKVITNENTITKDSLVDKSQIVSDKGYTILDLYNNLDKSIITIREYNQPDSSGKQSIKRDITINKDITTKRNREVVKTDKTEVKKDITQVKDSVDKKDTQIEIKESVKKTSILDKIGAYIILIAIIVVVVIIVLYGSKIKLFFTQLFSIFVGK